MTTMPDADIAAVKRRVNLLHLLAGEYRRVANTGGDEYAGPCPFCGGTDRLRIQPHRPDGGRWFCRQCTGEPPTGQWRDAFDYVMRRDGITFIEAYRLFANAPLPQQTRAAAESQATPIWHTPAWQTRAWQRIEKAHWLLRHADVAQSSRDYLFRRGLQPETWDAWQVGHGLVWNSVLEQKLPAILLPWHDGETVQAVQYRFTDASLDKAARYGQQADGDRHLFGLHLVTGQEALVLVEGELNAIAIWQACQPLSVDVVSWGPQASIVRPGVAKLAAELASHYDRVLLWAD